MAKSILLAAAMAAAAVSAGEVAKVGASSYDFFLLELQYPITICSDGTYSCTNNNQWFTLHGLWPENTDGSYPQYCTNESFNINEIQDLENELSQYWPSLNGAASTFWSHEWTKHGTCAEDVFPKEHDFFAGVLALREKYDIVTALGAAGIKPSNSAGFSSGTFKKVTQNAYGASAIPTCDSSGNINGAVVCVSKNLTAMTCPSNIADTGCKQSTVYLPASMTTSAPAAPAPAGDELSAEELALIVSEEAAAPAKAALRGTTA